MFSLGLGLGLGQTPSGSLNLPPGFVFLTEVVDGIVYYLTDDDGYYLIEAV